MKSKVTTVKTMDSTPADTSDTKNDRTLRLIASLDARLQCYSPMYTLFLSYALLNLVLFFFAAVKEFLKREEDPFLAWTIGIARGTGFLLNFNIALVVILAARKTITLLRITPIGAVLPLDSAMPEMHSVVGSFSFVCAVLHTIFHLIAGLIRNFWKPGFGNWTYLFITGTLLVLLFTFILITAVKPARRAHFQRFINIHLCGGVLFLVLILLHGFDNGVLYTYKWLVCPIIIYTIDRFVRVISQNKASLYVRVGQECSHLVYGGGIVRLSFPTPFRYKAGQYAEICVPLLSRTQWHPFTVASAPYERNMLFFIKNVGDWTGALHDLCESGLHPKSREPVESFEVHVRGPYGAPAQHVGQYDKILLISGGVGATPFCSITKEINEAISRNISHQDNKDDAIDMSQMQSPRKGQSSDSPLHDLRKTRPNIFDAGKTMFVQGLKRPRQHGRPYLAEVRKNPHLRKSRGHEDTSVIPTQTWAQFLHTIASTSLFNTSMLWIMLIRFAVNLLGVASNHVDFSNRGTDVFRSISFIWVDVILSCTFLVMLLFGILSELVSEGRAIAEECFILLPVSFFPFMFGCMAISGEGTSTGHLSFYHFVIGWPVLCVTFLLRYFRVLGGRALLSDTIQKSYQTTKSVDFIWTTKTREEDAWLIEELSNSLKNTVFVRLHRFITRETGPPAEPSPSASNSKPRSASHDEDRLFRDNYGRPNWKEILQNFSSKMRNGTTAGIFFCGPPQMAAQIKQAATMAMFDSRYRSISATNRLESGAKMQSLLFSQGNAGNIPDSLTRSFNIRFVFREEKF